MILSVNDIINLYEACLLTYDEARDLLGLSVPNTEDQ